MSTRKRCFLLILAFGLLGLVVAEIPYAFDNSVSENNVANIQRSGHTNQYPNGAYLLADFTNGMRSLFFKQCSICSLMWQQVGAGWSIADGHPSQYVCDQAPEESIPGCEPKVGFRAEFSGCNGGTSLYTVSWWSRPTAIPAISFDVDYKAGSHWYPFYTGGEGSKVYATTTGADFRIRGDNVNGSHWCLLAVYPRCDRDVGDGGGRDIP